MGMAQFAKVVLLPQGEFAAFLRATPDDRREVLERLFDITAFATSRPGWPQARRTAGADLEAARSALASAGSPASTTCSPTPRRRGAGTPVEVPPESVGAHLRDGRRPARHPGEHDDGGLRHGIRCRAGRGRGAGRPRAPLDDLRTRGHACRRTPRDPRGRPAEPRRAGGGPRRGRARRRPGRPPRRPRPGDRRRGRLPRRSGAARDALPPGPLAALPDDDVVERRSPGCWTSTAPPPRSAREADERGAARPPARRARRRAPTPLAAQGEALGPQLAAAEAERDRLAAEVEARAAGAGRRRRARAAARRRPRQGRPCSTPPSTTSPVPRASHRATPTCAPPPSTGAASCSTCAQRRLDGMAAELARSLHRRRPVPGVRCRRAPRTRNGRRPGAARRHRRGRAPARRWPRPSCARSRPRSRRCAPAPRTRLASLDGADREALEADGGRGAGALAGGPGRRRRPRRARRPGSRSSSPNRRGAARLARRRRGAASRRSRPSCDDLAAAEAEAARARRRPRAEHAECPCGSPDPAAHVRAGRALTDLAAAVADLGGAAPGRPPR